MNAAELKTVLEQHHLWLGENPNGKRADLRNADLQNADLRYANLRNADLQNADLRNANLRYADLRYANLQNADLRYADLQNADLRYANLRNADLPENFFSQQPQLRILPEGDLIGYKKLNSGIIAKLRIPADAKRSNATGRKCRAEYAIVLEGEGYSQYDPKFCYSPGKTVRADNFDEDWRVVCSGGIHFFITREEAEQY